MPSMAPPLRRLPKALLVAALTALVFGGVLGSAQASGDGPGGGPPDSLALPQPSVGDRWSYQAVLEGTWNFGPQDGMQVGQPFTYAEFEWLEPALARGGDGVEVAVDRVATKRLDYMVEDEYSLYGGHLWLPKEATYAYPLGGTEAIAVEHPDRSAEPGQSDGPLQGEALRVGTVEQVEGRMRSFGGTAAPCMARSGLQGRSVPLDRPVTLNPCLPPLDGRGPGDFDSTDLESILAPWGDGSGSYEAAAQETVLGHRTVRFDRDGGSVWLSPGLPVPVQMRGELGGDAVTLTLSSWRSGTVPVGAQGAQPHRADAPPVALAPRQPWGPDDSGVDHPFPASAAFQGALADPSWATLRDWMDDHPRGFTFMLEYHEDLDETPQQRSWLFGLTDGADTLTFAAVQSTTGPLPPAVRNHDMSWFGLGSWLDWLTPDPDAAPAELPTVASVLARWQAYEATEGRDTAANGWGMLLLCIVDCSYGTTATVMAGRDPVSFWNIDPGTMPGGVPSVRLPGNRTVEGSQLDVRASGETVALRHWTGYATTGATVGPLTAQPPVDGSPAPAGGVDPPLVAAFLPTPEQGAAITLASLLAGLLYWLWPSLKSGSFLGLFSRLRGPQLLEHPARARLVQIVQAEPGIHFQDLVRRAGLPNGTAVHHLGKLTKAGLLSGRALGRYTCYFPGSSPDRAALARAPILRSDGARRVYEAIQGRPGMSGLELAGLVGLQPSTVNYHVQRLVDCGLVLAAREGRSIRLSASPPATAAS